MTSYEFVKFVLFHEKPSLHVYSLVFYPVEAVLVLSLDSTIFFVTKKQPNALCCISSHQRFVLHPPFSNAGRRSFLSATQGVASPSHQRKALDLP